MKTPDNNHGLLKTLTNPTEDEINAAVAEYVAGWKCEMINGAWSGDPDSSAPVWTSPSGQVSTAYFIPAFTRSADAVLPLLEKWPGEWTKTGRMWIELSTYNDEDGPGTVEATADTFPLAACIALLRANGITVEFTK